MKHRPLLYPETSVFGFYYDEEPRNALRRGAVRTLSDQIDLGVLHAAVSLLTVDRVGGDFAVAPSHTTGRALLHPAVRRVSRT